MTARPKTTERFHGRVLLAGNFLSGHGLSRAPIEDLAERLSAEGFQVTAASPIRNRWLRASDLILTAVRKRARYDAAIVDLYSGRAFLWGHALTRLLRALGKPCVVCLHGGNLPGFARRHSKAVRACLQSASLVVAPSPYLAESMRPYRDGIAVFPNALPLSRYGFLERSRPRGELIWLRSFRRIYHPEMAPRVVHALRQRGRPIRLKMFGADWGDGSLERTRRTARDLGVSDCVSFGGPVPKNRVPRALAQGDIFLNTTDVDNTPVSVIEAMACGLCVVSTNVGGIPYLLEHEKDALLTPPGDAAQMAGAVERILASAELSGRLSRNARKKAEAFDWAAVLPRWVGALRAISAEHANSGAEPPRIASEALPVEER